MYVKHVPSDFKTIKDLTSIIFFSINVPYVVEN